MNLPSLSSETLHASCVAKGGRAMLISGASGSGKSDLALRLIDRGAKLVSDDYTVVQRVEGRLLASAPKTIAGKMEVRGLGLVEMEPVRDVPVCLVIDLARGATRIPDLEDFLMVAGVKLPVIGLNGLEASAPLKVEMALDRFGLSVD
ncbi:MAG TPA: HPr kinase/phosphatase C-terminal domain-containing protein [Allosphingosinicella sp.]|nr:HPr kinase/phosphatase C-terminal domain-containing protein [Allosphingosinicella sp.]